MTSLISLSDWLQDHSEDAIAIQDGVLIYKNQFRLKVLKWKSSLLFSSGQKWAVYHNDAVEFLAIIYALWQSRCTACIPGDNFDTTVERLESSVSGFLGEFENTEQLSTDSDSYLNEIMEPIDKGFPAIEVYTSGSTGEPKSIVKTIGQMDSELESIESLWPFSTSSTLLATVTHQHLFGLTFRLFWPLSKGQLFQSKLCSLTEEIYQQASLCEKYILISTPAHLSRLNNQLDWNDLKGKCEAAISSAAPLKYEDSRYASELLNASVLEIYGSSETGAIAWRNQVKKSADLWTLLPGVTLSQEQEKFTVKGGHISAEYEVLSDRLERISERDFRLHGRTDRIAKVEGKRISLTKVENTILETGWVSDVKALVLSRKREEVAIVAVLNSQAISLVEQYSVKWLTHKLKDQLRQEFELVLLPRRWRFVSALPYNQQGKLPMSSMQNLFEKKEVKWPTEVEFNQEGQKCSFKFHIPQELIYFDGHFEANPILPGIVQTHWAQHYGRQVFGFNGDFLALEAVKFQQVIFPNSSVELVLEFRLDTLKLLFQYVSDKGIHSSGRICFE